MLTDSDFIPPLRSSSLWQPNPHIHLSPTPTHPPFTSPSLHPLPSRAVGSWQVHTAELPLPNESVRGQLVPPVPTPPAADNRSKHSLLIGHVSHSGGHRIVKARGTSKVGGYFNGKQLSLSRRLPRAVPAQLCGLTWSGAHTHITYTHTHARARMGC